MRFLNYEFNKFFLVGVTNTAVYFLIYLASLHVGKLHYMIAHVIAVIVSMLGSFLLNTMYTYRVKPTLKKLLLFPLTQAFNIVCTVAMLFILVDLLRLSESFAPFIAIFVTVPLTFVITGRVLKAA